MGIEPTQTEGRSKFVYTPSFYKIFNTKTHKYVGQTKRLGGRVFTSMGALTNHIGGQRNPYNSDYVIVELREYPTRRMEMTEIIQGIKQRAKQREDESRARHRAYQEQRELEEYNRLKKKFG